MKIPELKQQLEMAIEQRLAEFKSLAERYKVVLSELDLMQKDMTSIAVELKSVEHLIRLSDDTYPNMFNELLKIKPKGKNHE